MENEVLKICGWVLVIGGTAIIALTVFYSFQVFTARSAPPPVFSFQAEDLSVPSEEDLLEQKIRQELVKLVPRNTVVKLLNLMAWSLGAGVISFGGSKLCLLGIKMVYGDNK